MEILANIENPTIWIVLAVVALLLFGGQRIPEFMRGLGGGMRAFKEGMHGDSPAEPNKDH